MCLEIIEYHRTNKSPKHKSALPIKVKHWLETFYAFTFSCSLSGNIHHIQHTPFDWTVIPITYSTTSKMGWTTTALKKYNHYKRQRQWKDCEDNQHKCHPGREWIFFINKHSKNPINTFNREGKSGRRRCKNGGWGRGISLSPRGIPVLETDIKWQEVCKRFSKYCCSIWLELSNIKHKIKSISQ